MQTECVGAIDGEPLAIDSETLLTLLSSPVTINSEGNFVGKPGTRLYATDSLVLKRPCDESMSSTQAITWCQKQLDRERCVGGYHPARTWVAFCKNKHWAVANITPRLPTLEQTLLGPLPSTVKLSLLLGMFECFFSTYAHSDFRQDEGLSNYVVEGDQVWYIDDDIYGQDRLMAFSVSLGSFIRTQDWLNATGAYYLGCRLRGMIKGIDNALIERVYKGFSDAFLPDNKERVRQALLRGLSARKKQHRPPVMAGRIAVLADIHGNLPALNAVLADCEQRNLKTGLVLGDIVGYGPDPAECVERTRASGFHVLMGNHDLSASGGMVPAGLNRAARWSAPWTYQALSDQQRQWLRELPHYYQDKHFYAAHGAPQDPTFLNAYVYARTAESNLDYMRTHGFHLCLHGHSHLPGVWYRDRIGEAAFIYPEHFTLDSADQVMICPGSVGQPRNGESTAQYLVLDLTTQSAEFVQVGYDRQAVIERMARMDFPDYVVRVMDSP